MNWVIQRGNPISQADYDARADKAEAEIVEVLADGDEKIVKRAVRGMKRNKAGRMRSISVDPGVWEVTCTDEVEDDDPHFQYRFLPIDPDGRAKDAELYGSLTALRSQPLAGEKLPAKPIFAQGNLPSVKPKRMGTKRDPHYRRLKIRTDFLLEHWPEVRQAGGQRDLGRATKLAMIEACGWLAHEWSPDYQPLNKTEFEKLLNGIFPNSRRDQRRNLSMQFLTAPPKSGRRKLEPDREERLSELISRYKNIIAKQNGQKI